MVPTQSRLRIIVVGSLFLCVVLTGFPGRTEATSDASLLAEHQVDSTVTSTTTARQGRPGQVKCSDTKDGCQVDVILTTKINLPAPPVPDPRQGVIYRKAILRRLRHRHRPIPGFLFPSDVAYNPVDLSLSSTLAARSMALSQLYKASSAELAADRAALHITSAAAAAAAASSSLSRPPPASKSSTTVTAQQVATRSSISLAQQMREMLRSQSSASRQSSRSTM